jgi:hypothetical protein
MNKTKTKTKKRAKCRCGGFKYTYVKSNDARKELLAVHVCFKCGRFKGESLSEEVIQLFCSEPELLMHMIHSGYLKRVG